MTQLRLSHERQPFRLTLSTGAKLNFFQAIRSGYAKYANFSGRARRAEYWYFTLLAFGLSTALQLVTKGKPFESSLGIVLWLITASVVLPSVAVTARRLHDIGKSAWWMLLGAIPIIGALILLVWMVARGTGGPNRYGPDPVEQ
jgi:uncharacterized membrane protein YhaH (DUF805 family)